MVSSSFSDLAAAHAGALAPLYLVVAAAGLVLALRCLKRAVVPVGELMQALAAAVVGVLSLGVALILIVAALLTMVRG
jgi:hypothetical protein